MFIPPQRKIDGVSNIKFQEIPPSSGKHRIINKKRGTLATKQVFLQMLTEIPITIPGREFILVGKSTVDNDCNVPGKANDSFSPKFRSINL